MDILTVKQRMKEIIAENTKLDAASIDEGAHLHKDLGIDSLTLLEVALSIDAEFETDFEEEELLGMESVAKASTMVVERLTQKG